MVPYCGGAFLPTEQRLTSSIYRRLKRVDRAQWLSLEELAELVAVIRLVGSLRAATVLFGWNWAQRHQIPRILAHEPAVARSEAYHQANLAALSEEDGEMCLKALLENGWKQGRPPWFVVRTLQARRGRGESAKKTGDFFGISAAKIQVWITPRPKHLKKHDKASLSLLVG